MTNASRVLQALTEGPATASELSAELGMPNNTVSAYLCYLMRTGRATRTVHKKGWQRAYLWEVVDVSVT
jgi:DNA-binding IclR family transcriptional regulator